MKRDRRHPACDLVDGAGAGEALHPAGGGTVGAMTLGRPGAEASPGSKGEFPGPGGQRRGFLGASS